MFHKKRSCNELSQTYSIFFARIGWHTNSLQGSKNTEFAFKKKKKKKIQSS